MLNLCLTPCGIIGSGFSPYGWRARKARQKYKIYLYLSDRRRVRCIRAEPPALRTCGPQGCSLEYKKGLIGKLLHSATIPASHTLPYSLLSLFSPALPAFFRKAVSLFLLYQGHHPVSKRFTIFIMDTLPLGFLLL